MQGHGIQNLALGDPIKAAVYHDVAKLMRLTVAKWQVGLGRRLAQVLCDQQAEIESQTKGLLDLITTDRRAYLDWWSTPNGAQYGRIWVPDSNSSIGKRPELVRTNPVDVEQFFREHCMTVNKGSA